MEPNGHAANSFYNYLIRPDKSATRQLEDLCLGLAGLIRDIDPGQYPDNELTPQRLATFYRRLGGNYEPLFLHTSDDGLSFMYRTLGCFHSLQPTRSPFETPRVPCLTSHGFARWQTIQLLLSPHEHAPYLQKAVQVFDIPRPDGGYFPKDLPRQCLPDRPDQAMEKWYREVTGSLNPDKYMRRLKYSPAQSPHLEPIDRRDSYFPNGQSRSRLSRSNSHDDESARLAAHRRRSSVPDLPSPQPAIAERSPHWDPAAQHSSRKSRSHSATRPPAHNRPGSHTTTANPNNHHYHSSKNPPSRHHPSRPHDHSRPLSQQQLQAGQRLSGGQHRSPSTVDEFTGSEASSEGSNTGQKPRHRRSDEEGKSRNSLWMPSFLRTSYQRRHSSEAGVRKIEAAKPHTPLRPEYYGTKSQNVAPHVIAHAPPVMAPQHRQPHAGVRFRSDMFDDATRSPLDSPVQLPKPSNVFPPPAIRYPEPQQHPGIPTQQMESMSMATQIASRDSSSGSGTDRRYHSGSDWDRDAQRKAGAPLRVATVTGVSGRKYASPEQQMAEQQHARIRSSAPTTVV